MSIAARTRWIHATQRAPLTIPKPVSSVGRAVMAFSAFLASTSATIAKMIGPTNHARMAQTNAATAVPSVVGAETLESAHGSAGAGTSGGGGGSLDAGAAETGGGKSGESVTSSFLPMPTSTERQKLICGPATPDAGQ